MTAPATDTDGVLRILSGFVPNGGAYTSRIIGEGGRRHGLERLRDGGH
jgi:hypothetical protein